jgi:diketogulonate reductase-like aldo/keto reductase
MTDRTVLLDGHPVPRFLYGTAWKENDTQRLVALALEQGFRGIDTANQRKHYQEERVGQALATAFAGGLVTRKDVFLQSKFTFQAAQDHRLPYDRAAPVGKQVAQSFASSLDHLGTDFLDSYVLHGPSVRNGLATADWEAWRAMETIHAAGETRLLGISNVDFRQLESLCRDARVCPHFVQNRCYASQGWDRRVREFCQSHNITYQGFSLLTANRAVLAHPELQHIAKNHGRTPAQIVFRFALDVGMLPLTGTTNVSHMRSDLDVFEFQLKAAEVAQIERLGEG